MAIIGQQLLTPETGWKRYSYADSRIVTTGTWGVASGEEYTSNGTITFKFYGSKIRYIGSTNTDRTNNLEITIDGVVYNFTQYYVSGYNIFQFEKLDLPITLHTVSIVSKPTNGKSTYAFSAIDIDNTGELKPYDYIPYYFLIKQNSNYYTIKTTNYDAITVHNFLPLTLTGGITPNKSDIETLGFSDLKLLTNNMVVGSDSFSPISKFDNTAELIMYKSI